jgi:hypothetical protein
MKINDKFEVEIFSDLSGISGLPNEEVEKFTIYQKGAFVLYESKIIFIEDNQVSE